MLEERVEAAAVQQRWEYRCDVLNSFDKLEDTLNDIGEDRWELVCVASHEGKNCAIFKRPQRMIPQRRQSTFDEDASDIPRRLK